MSTEYRPHSVVWTPETIDRLWAFYASSGGTGHLYFSARVGSSILRFVRRRILLRGRRILDFGCGPGYLLEELLREGAVCQGLEFSPRSAEAATRRLGAVKDFLGVSLASKLPSGLPNGGFDVVFLVEVIEHLADGDLREVFREVRRLLVPGGHIVITCPNAEDLGAALVHCPECGCTFNQWQHVRTVTRDGLRDLGHQAGFEEVVCKTTLFEPPASLGWRFVRWAHEFSGWARGSHPVRPHLAYIGKRSFD
jgi:SAM-dependent methyltransferase